MHICKLHQILQVGGKLGGKLFMCVISVVVAEMPPGFPAPLPRGAIAPQFWLVFGVRERRGSKSSPLVLLAQKEVLSQQVRIDDFTASPCLWCHSSLLWCWQPRSILASGISEGSCPEARGLVPPSCSLLWHRCRLAKQSPISK